MNPERRINDHAQLDAAIIMGVLYTVVYMLMVGMLMIVTVPPENSKTVDILVGAMTVIQTSVVSYFFGSTKFGKEALQAQSAAKERTDSTLREMVVATAATTNGGDHAAPPVVAAKRARKSTKRT